MSTFVIAEIGINHNGDINIAKKLIDVAVFAGCDAVKFQKRTIELVYTPEELAKEREKLERKVNEMKRASAQEKAMTEAMLKKQQEDKARIKRIEKLWKRARLLYNKGMYEEAIKDFDEIIKLEGGR